MTDIHLHKTRAGDGEREHSGAELSSNQKMSAQVFGRVSSSNENKNANESNITTGDARTGDNQSTVSVGGDSTSIKYPRQAPGLGAIVPDESRSTQFGVTTPVGGLVVSGESKRYRDLKDADLTCDVASDTMGANLKILHELGYEDYASQLASMTLSTSRQCADALGKLEINTH